MNCCDLYSRAIDRRQKLLQQLYAVTVSFLGLKVPNFDHNDVESFLDANDISK